MQYKLGFLEGNHVGHDVDCNLILQDIPRGQVIYLP